jgi:hypothetical protein
MEETAWDQGSYKSNGRNTPKAFFIVTTLLISSHATYHEKSKKVFSPFLTGALLLGFIRPEDRDTKLMLQMQAAFNFTSTRRW